MKEEELAEQKRGCHTDDEHKAQPDHKCLNTRRRAEDIIERSFDALSTGVLWCPARGRGVPHVIRRVVDRDRCNEEVHADRCYEGNMKQCTQNKQEKCSIIAFAHAIVKPSAMMVETSHTLSLFGAIEMVKKDARTHAHAHSIAVFGFA